MQRITLSLPDNIVSALRTVATAQERTISDVVREALRSWVAAQNAAAAGR